MSFNDWNNPEYELERTAIDHYLDDLDSNQILDDWQELLRDGTVSLQEIRSQMISELFAYDVDMDKVDNVEYLNDQFTERMKQFGFNLGKDIR